MKYHARCALALITELLAMPAKSAGNPHGAPIGELTLCNNHKVSYYGQVVGAASWVYITLYLMQFVEQIKE